MLLAGCQLPVRSPTLELVRRSQPLLGTFVTISAYGPDRARLNAAVSDAFAEIHRVDAVMSLHRPDSELSRLNALAVHKDVVVSDELFGVLVRAAEIARRTEGSFDVTIRPIADLWGFIWKDHRLPTPAELREALPRVGYLKMRLDAERRTVRFLEPGVSLDLGGIGKGHAVDRAIARLHQHGITNALVKAGGDVRVTGRPPGQRDWSVQLEDPRKQGRRVAVRLRDAALSTSGNYENFFDIAGRRYSHILDPRSGLPVQGVASCTVIAPTCTESDAWATACMVYGVERSLRDFGNEFPMRFVLVPEPRASKAWPVMQSSGMRHVLK